MSFVDTITDWEGGKSLLLRTHPWGFCVRDATSAARGAASRGCRDSQVTPQIRSFPNCFCPVQHEPKLWPQAACSVSGKEADRVDQGCGCLSALSLDSLSEALTKDHRLGVKQHRPGGQKSKVMVPEGLVSSEDCEETFGPRLAPSLWCWLVLRVPWFESGFLSVCSHCLSYPVYTSFSSDGISFINTPVIGLGPHHTPVWPQFNFITSAITPFPNKVLPKYQGLGLYHMIFLWWGERGEEQDTTQPVRVPFLLLGLLWTVFLRVERLLRLPWGSNGPWVWPQVRNYNPTCCTEWLKNIF